MPPHSVAGKFGAPWPYSQPVAPQYISAKVSGMIIATGLNNWVIAKSWNGGMKYWNGHLNLNLLIHGAPKDFTALVGLYVLSHQIRS